MLLTNPRPDTFREIYMCCGYTDMRKSIDGLAGVVYDTYGMDPYREDVLFLFCGGAAYKLKGIVWEYNGFLLIQKRLRNTKFKWIRDASLGMKQITFEQYHHLINEGTLS